MHYTRRTVLRDASRLFTGAVASSTFPSLLSSQPTNIWTNGIRIFFVGTWLFCPDPDSSGLLAITDDANMGHTFPYGPWQKSGFDNNPSLKENHTPPGQVKKNSYDVTVSYAATTPNPPTAASVSALFQTAQQNCGFNYVAQNLSPTFGKSGIRVISFPLPTRLFVAGFLPNGNISSSQYPLLGSGTPGMAHVFDYQQASSLSFMSQTTPAAQDFSANFHFHTVPQDTTYHGPEMFAALMMDVLNVSTISLMGAEPQTGPTPGSCLPSCFDMSELDSPGGGVINCPQSKGKGKHTPKTKTTASCAGGGLGVGGGGS